MPLALLLTEVCEREVGEAKWIKGTLNALSLLWRLQTKEHITNLFKLLQIFRN